MDISQKRARELFKYVNGNLFWRHSQNNQIKAGDLCGYIGNYGYRFVGVDGRRCAVHRIIFILNFGYAPEEVDHIDGDTFNNNKDNLRACSRAQNTQNAKIRKDNTSGVKGVDWNKASKKWRGRITAFGVTKNLGLFDKIKDAELVVNSERVRLHGEFANFGELEK